MDGKVITIGFILEPSSMMQQWALSGSKSSLFWCWWNYHGQGLLWRMVLRFSLCNKEVYNDNGMFAANVFRWTMLRNINLRVYQEMVLITKMLVPSMLFRQPCILQGSSCYMFQFISLDIVLMTWDFGHLLSNMQLGCIMGSQKRWQDSLQ